MVKAEVTAKSGSHLENHSKPPIEPFHRTRKASLAQIQDPVVSKLWDNERANLYPMQFHIAMLSSFINSRDFNSHQTKRSWSRYDPARDTAHHFVCLGVYHPLRTASFRLKFQSSRYRTQIFISRPTFEKSTERLLTYANLCRKAELRGWSNGWREKKFMDSRNFDVVRLPRFRVGASAKAKH